MKTKTLTTVCALLLSANCFSAQDLRISQEVWFPNPNTLPITSMQGPSNETYDLGEDDGGRSFTLHNGSRFAMGCNTDVAINTFTWLAVGPDGEIAEATPVSLGQAFTLKEGFHYLLRATIDNLSSCMAYGYTFIAVKR